MYWLKRLDEIAQVAAQAGEEQLAEDAEWTIDVMLGELEERESTVLSEYERPIEWAEWFIR